VQLACRPEAPYLVSEGIAGSRLKASVTFVRDVVLVRDSHLQTEIGPMLVEYARGETERSFTVGQETIVTLPVEALHVFPRNERAAA